MSDAGRRRDSFKGFPRGVGFTNVPNPLLAGLLEEIDDLAELKVTLRLIWTINQKRGHLRYATKSELCADRTVASMLDASGEQLESAVTRALEKAVGRGTLLEAGGRYFLNTAPNRAALERVAKEVELPPVHETRQAPDHGSVGETVFTLYEENIAPLTPLIGERIALAVSEYGESAVREAVGVAVGANARNWNYIAAVLKRMADQGRLEGTDGEPGRDTAEDRDAFIEQYRERQRQRGNG